MDKADFLTQILCGKKYQPKYFSGGFAFHNPSLPAYYLIKIRMPHLSNENIHFISIGALK